MDQHYDSRLVVGHIHNSQGYRVMFWLNSAMMYILNYLLLPDFWVFVIKISSCQFWVTELF